MTTIDNNRLNSLKVFQSIDFGDIDGLYDPNISKYFVDRNYWQELIEGRKFFVIGRKGTGKSAIYNWVEKQAKGRHVLVSNLSFRSFPFEKLLQLSDDNFSKPNQYQSIWRNIVLSEICKLIIDDPKKDISHPCFSEISKFVAIKFGTELSELHTKVATQTIKKETGLFLQSSHNIESLSSQSESSDGFSNITQINTRLEHVIREYLSNIKSSKYVIQFDQLDDNYTVYIENNEYFQSIISLFKVIYDINQSFYRDSLPVKVIAYLRTDIFYEINKYDAESARWDDHKLYLSWAIINRSDWGNPLLMNMLDSRIVNSCPEMKNYQRPFSTLFKDIKLKNNNGQLQSVFSYIVRRSFQRPRDLIQFVKKIQDGCRQTNRLNERNILDAEKTYSLWLLTEIANEFGPLVKSKDRMNDFLRSFGSKDFSYEDFVATYNVYEEEIGLKPDDILDLLYRLGILTNVNNTSRGKEYFSIIRNEQSSLNKNMRIELHRGIVKGLHAFTKD